jgi:Domain of unknown function DUF29
MSDTLYNQDLQKWIEQTIEQLKNQQFEIIDKAYLDARKLAIKESKFANFGIDIPKEQSYPSQCPFTLEQILDEDFYN